MYLTSENWSDAPSDETVKSMRAAVLRGETQSTVQFPLDQKGKAAWKRWRITPVARERAKKYPQLFALSREFWRERVDALSKKEYAETKFPDYREPERQVIFDDTWNLVGPPGRIRRQIEALRTDVDPQPNAALWYWLYPAEFTKVTGWSRSGHELNGGWWDFVGTAEDDLTVDRAATYHVWVQFRQIAYQEPWKLDVTSPGRQKITFVRDKVQDIVWNVAWQQVGTVDMGAKQAKHFKFTPLPKIDPASYRFIYGVFVTPDANYKPSGYLRPALSKGQYEQRAARAAAKVDDGYVLRAVAGLVSANQSWWPRIADGPDPDEGRPVRRPATVSARANKWLGDDSVMMLPSRHGPVSMPSFEGIQEGAQADNLATMIKERGGTKTEAMTNLIAEGSPRELIEWLEAHPVKTDD